MTTQHIKGHVVPRLGKSNYVEEVMKKYIKYEVRARLLSYRKTQLYISVNSFVGWNSALYNEFD